MCLGNLRLETVLEAYKDCKAGKGDTYNALQFEAEYESKCKKLCDDVNKHTYHPERSIVFIVEKPVKREVFAPSFESRVGDHIVANVMEPLLENYLLDENFSTRKGKGTSYGIRFVANAIKECTNSYTENAWVMKTDVESCFMSMPKERLYNRAAWFVDYFYHGDDKMEIIYLLWAIIFDRPEKHCVRRCPIEYWNGLPPRKSLFFTDGVHGLPIGRLVSQLTVSLYLDEIDKFIVTDTDVDYFGRYVDDIVMVHQNKEVLLHTRQSLAQKLHEMDLRMHPKKLYLQHYTKGVEFIGGFIKPGRIYASKRSVGFAFDAVARWNEIALANPERMEELVEKFVSVMNSYLGHLKQFCSYNIRGKLVGCIDEAWWRMIEVTGDYTKVKVKQGYRECDRVLKELRMWEGTTSPPALPFREGASLKLIS